MFRRHISKGELPSSGSITQPYHIPVYLVPGIFRNPHEMVALAEQLNIINKGQRPIYIYHEQTTPDTTTSERIVSALNHVLPRDPVPCLLVGYSDGCDKAVAAAKTLQSQGRTVQVCAIDGAPASVASQYFSSHSSAAVVDLINIVNYAAQLSGFKNKITLSSTEITNLFNTLLESRIDHLAILARHHNPDADAEAHHAFLGYILDAKNNFKTKKREDDQAATLKVDKMVGFFTNPTMLNYGAGNKVGWEKETSNFTLITDPVLSEISHQEILKMPHAGRLARMIDTHFLQPAIDPEAFIALQDAYWEQEKEYTRASSSKSARASSSNSDTDSDHELFFSSDGDTPPPSRSPSSSPTYRPISARQALVSSTGLYARSEGASDSESEDKSVNVLKRSGPN